MSDRVRQGSDRAYCVRTNHPMMLTVGYVPYKVDTIKGDVSPVGSLPFEVSLRRR